MGFFNKIKLIFSGAEGQAEANIINALDYMTHQLSKKDMQRADPDLLHSFAYGIASSAYSAANPHAPDSDIVEKIFPLVRKVLRNYGLNGDGGHNSNATIIGARYMNGVIYRDKVIYMSAIDSIVLLIEQNLYKEPKSMVWYIVVSIVATLVLLYILNM